MKKLFLASALSLAAMAALATETINPVGLGIGYGLGQAAASSTSESSVRNQVGIANQVGLATTVGLSNGPVSSFGGGASATSNGGTGVGGNATAGGAVVGAGAGAVSVANNYKQAAASAYAPRASGPATSCRLFVGLGGTNTSGSLSGGIPIGNDQTCLSDKKLSYMDAINDRFSGTFNKGDYLEAICVIEGMDVTQGCIDFKSNKAPVVQPALPAGYAN